jgi:hypothetical protein
MGGACSAYGRGESRAQCFVVDPEGKRPLGISRCRGENNIKMDLYELGCLGIDWIVLDQHRDRSGTLLNAAMNIRVP